MTVRTRPSRGPVPVLSGAPPSHTSRLPAPFLDANESGSTVNARNLVAQRIGAKPICRILTIHGTTNHDTAICGLSGGISKGVAKCGACSREYSLDLG